MTLKHTQQKIEEEFGHFKHLGSLVEIEKWWLAKITETLQDFIRETSVEEEKHGFMPLGVSDDPWNKAVRLIKQKQDNYMQGI